jgi:hypothetical protein
MVSLLVVGVEVGVHGGDESPVALPGGAADRRGALGTKGAARHRVVTCHNGLPVTEFS